MKGVGCGAALNKHAYVCVYCRYVDTYEHDRYKNEDHLPELLSAKLDGANMLGAGRGDCYGYPTLGTRTIRMSLLQSPCLRCLASSISEV